MDVLVYVLACVIFLRQRQTIVLLSPCPSVYSKLAVNMDTAQEACNDRFE